MGQYLEFTSFEFKPDPHWECRSDQTLPMWEYLKYIGKTKETGTLCADDIVKIMEVALDNPTTHSLKWWDIEKLIEVLRAIEDEDGDRNVYHYHKD